MSASALPLLDDKEKPFSINECIICQKEKKKEKLTGTENGRRNLSLSAAKLKDEMFKEIEKHDVTEIVYHTTCYKAYVLKGSRIKDVGVEESEEETTSQNSESRPPRSKRSRLDVAAEAVCIICNQSRNKGQRKLFRI